MKNNIVLVDDPEAFTLIYSKIVSIVGVDCGIQRVSNGLDAVDIINKYLDASTAIDDFMFIDLTMDVPDGLEFLRIFSSIDFNRAVAPTVVVMSYTMNLKTRKRAKDMGFEYIVSHPLTEEEFRTILL